MKIEDIKKLTKEKEYDFLRENEHLRSNVCLLVLGGSHAYGTNIEGSDVDIRGAALPSRDDILLGRDFEQVVDTATDTTIYSFRKMVKLLCEQNPNMLEILFVKPEHILYMDTAGEMLMNNKEIFLTKKIFHTCGGYAKEQLRRLDTKSARTLSQAQQEAHIINSINSAKDTFPKDYFYYDKDAIRLYLDDALEEGGLEKEIFMDVSLSHYPLRDYRGMWNTMNSILRDYNKAGKRAKSAYARGAVNKHGMHLTRLLLLAERALRTGDMSTYMEEDHNLLMDIRNGKYMGDDGQMTPEFFLMINDLEKKMKAAYEKTALPEEVDKRRVEALVKTVMDDVVCRAPRKRKV